MKRKKTRTISLPAPIDEGPGKSEWENHEMANRACWHCLVTWNTKGTGNHCWVCGRWGLRYALRIPKTLQTRNMYDAMYERHRELAGGRWMWSVPD